MVVRPLNSGWRYFPSRDVGVVGLTAVGIRVADPAASRSLWTGLLSGRVSDYVGDAAFIRLDAVHHRIALHPSRTRGILNVEFCVEGIDQLMQNSYWLQKAQVQVVHGPGHRPFSDQSFITFRGPDSILFTLATKGDEIAAPDRCPRQFRKAADSFCSWGSLSEVPEWQGRPS